MTLPGTMMNFPLTLPTILERAGGLFPRVEIVSRRPDCTITRTTYGEMYKRARRFASALKKLGMQSGDRVAYVESLGTSGGVLGRALRRRHPAHAQPAVAPARNRRHCSPREGSFSDCGRRFVAAV